MWFGTQGFILFFAIEKTDIKETQRCLRMRRSLPPEHVERSSCSLNILVHVCGLLLPCHCPTMKLIKRLAFVVLTDVVILVQYSVLAPTGSNFCLRIACLGP